MITLSPKQMFQSNDEHVKAFGNIAHNPIFQAAVSHAVTQFTLTKKPTAEEISGVTKFIDIMMNMGERDESPTVTQFKSITTLLPQPDKPPTKSK